MKNMKKKAGTQAKDFLKYRVGFLGIPDSVMDEANPPESQKGWHAKVPWSLENLSTLKHLGFNTIQINVAW